jgi:hypothetical protein
MKAEEKARDLLKNMYDNGIDWEMAKQCALIAVDEIMLTSNNIQLLYYFEEVKQEIEKL